MTAIAEAFRKLLSPRRHHREDDPAVEIRDRMIREERELKM